MELSVKKINKAMESFIDKGNYKYAPSKYMFDYVSDPDYVYMIIDMVYVIRVPRTDMPQILSATHSQIRTDVNVERMIDAVVGDIKAHDYYFKGITKLKGDKEVAEFKDSNDGIVYIDAKFFKQYYNHNIIDNGVPSNITFTGISEKKPLVMWEDDEAIALFLPIISR